MIDMAGVLTTYLRSQSALMTLVNDKVYCDEMPEQTEAPFVLVRALSVTPAAPPTIAYDIYSVQVDCVTPAGSYEACMTLTDQVRSLLFSATGLRSNTRVTSVQIATATVGVDDTVSPAQPRWVLTVDVTGRGN